MGRAEVRQAVTDYLQSAGLPYVGTIYPARPVIADETAYALTMSGEAIQASANGSAALLVTNIPSDVRQRRADVGRGAVDDTEIHDIALEVFFASTGGSSVNAQQDYDTVIDSIITAIRANATPGGADVVWSAGEFEYGVQHEQDQPTTSEDGMTVVIWGVVRFQAWEWIAG